MLRSTPKTWEKLHYEMMEQKEIANNFIGFAEAKNFPCPGENFSGLQRDQTTTTRGRYRHEAVTAFTHTKLMNEVSHEFLLLDESDP